MKCFLITLLAIVFSLSGWAKKPASKSKVAPSAKNLKLETDVDFTGRSFLGKYANSSEVNADVEAEKKLINVVEPRHDFKFQLKKSKEWH